MSQNAKVFLGLMAIGLPLLLMVFFMFWIEWRRWEGGTRRNPMTDKPRPPRVECPDCHLKYANDKVLAMHREHCDGLDRSLRESAVIIPLGEEAHVPLSVARKALERERRLDCEAMCVFCADGDVPERHKRGFWIHGGYSMVCRASPIRERKTG